MQKELLSRCFLIEAISLLLLPANEVCEGYVFTGVCLSTGVLPYCMLGYTLQDQKQTPPRQTPPGTRSRHPQVDNPLGIHPLLGRQPPPPVQCMLGYDQQVGGTHPTGIQSCSQKIPSVTLTPPPPPKKSGPL